MCLQQCVLVCQTLSNTIFEGLKVYSSSFEWSEQVYDLTEVQAQEFVGNTNRSLSMSVYMKDLTSKHGGKNTSYATRL